MDASVEDLEEVMGMLRDGGVRVVVDSAWGMEEALEGYKIMESGRARGKIVIRVGEGAE